MLTVSVVGLDALDACHALRRVVFVEGQGVPAEREVDGLDPQSTHFLAVLDGRPVGTARMREVDGCAKAERVAVLGELRGEGIGRALMDALEEEARRRGLSAVVLGAQDHAVPFYDRLGYRREGDWFEDAGIPHMHMRKSLR